MTTLRDKEAVQRRRNGLALAAVRRRAGITQDAAAAAMSWKGPQAWQYYEHGKRHFSDPKLALMLQALGSNREEFDLELAKIPEEREALPAVRGRGVEEPTFGRSLRFEVGGIAHGGSPRPNVYDDGGAEVIDFERYFAPGMRILRLGGMSMYPYAEPGGFVTYNVKVPPRRGEGCVIEMADGSFQVKRFERYDGDALIVSEAYPEEVELAPIPADQVKGVYAVQLRG